MSSPGNVPPAERSSRFPFQFWLLMFAIPAIVLAGGFALGGGPVVAVVLAVVALVAVFVGVGGIMQRRGFEEQPGRHPVPPPSA